MAALPLTLDTLQTPGNESITLQTPLMSPQQCLKADSSSSSSAAGNDMMETPERPSNLTLETTHQQQQQQHHLQHSNVTPSHGNISPALSSAGSLSPSFLPEMPQWKRDLIQRRKQNVQRTISASSPSSTTTTSSSSPTTIAMAIGGLKTSTSSSSVRSLAGSNTNIDQLASDGLQQVCSTKDYTKTSLLTYANTTTKVNKQYITTTTTSTKPANNIKSYTKTSSSSPLKEKAEKLFGGQYTATTPTSLSSSSSSATFTTKEEITTPQRLNKECKVNIQQENNEMTEENQKQEHFEMYRNTNKLEEEEQQDEEAELLNDETETTTTTAIITNKQQQMATRLTGSSYNTNTTTTTTSTQHNTASSSSSSSSSSAIVKRAETERESLVNSQPHYHNNIAVGNLQNQSLNKCESERLVCAANTTNITNITGNSINFNNNNTNNSVTIGGISVGINNSSVGGSSSSASVVKISQKLQENQFIKNEQHLNIKKLNKFKQNTTSGGNNISLDLKSPTKTTTTNNVLTTSNSYSCLTSSSSSSSSATLANCAIKKKMVAVQEMKKSTQTGATHLHPITSTCQATNRANNRSGGGGGAASDLDTSEDLSYGPGIVSKLRCRYLSLALRESMEQQRLNKDQLRRSTSLNNLLDNNEDEEENCEDDEEEEDEPEDEENQGFDYKTIRNDTQNGDSHIMGCKKMGILKTSINNGQEKRYSSNTQGSNGVGVTFTETSYNKRSRHLKRGNDSLKRARSVEALLSEKSPWHTRANSSAPNCGVTIEDKIHNARERLQQGTDHLPPKRLTSIIDDTERPPPDLVKQTLKMFEATANRRPRTTNRSNSKGDVASKVETFKNIIKEQKPVVTYPKPLSPTKKLQKPLKTSTPQAQDLLQSPLGRKALAIATSINNTQDCLTPLKTNQTTLSEHTPDIIPRQKFNNERDFKQNKELFNSKEKLDTPLSSLKRDHLIKEKFEVDSPLTALTKELSKLKLNDTTPNRKTDNCAAATSSSDNHESMNNKGSSSMAVGGVVSGVAGRGDNNGDGGDACQRQNNKYPYSNNDFKNEETQQEFNNISSLKNENDKINNKNTKPNNNETATSSTIDTKNEPAATVNNYECLTKAGSPPPSSSDLSDGGENYDDDEYGGLKTTKRITRTALDNIAKAGYTQQFKFNTSSSSNSNSSAPSTPNNTTNSTSSSSATPLNTTQKQIGVIRPLLNTQQQKTETTMETLKHSTPTSLTSREIEKNRINDLKKSSTANSHTNNTVAASAANSSPSASQLDHVIKTTTHNTTSPASGGASSAATAAAGYSDVDSVISATNSPLWAMRKRRQAPPAAPAENTSMVFNFSNRKEVPDYIENDGVIFRRKRELPKPNESGFVLLGDLSVETSTDMDYDDFSMCPPSPCDVEFVNANIVIDGKSSIRQKSKDTAFRVQFNDTLTSTFEYPSEASLIVDESFSAYNESYTQPLGSSCSAPDDFTQAFQNLCLENATSHHHVADEIIQLPTFNASSPAVAANNTNTPTKNILGNLPLDVI
ncbi:serine-rich adhesin for platelets isoform X2 [Calliphora vicina]|uniref:serine-rich adhesin for platelets isoform X2 n=1 Tax=Calliphora vicina TaxID=7373 RepID=UPI00325B9A51